jgi:ectoine hydroxylase-related dioxygenase (phytanoyl-CoA dioxygenase family)
MMPTLEKLGYFTRNQINQTASDFYREQGFLVVTDALSLEEVEEIKNEAVAVCRQEKTELHISHQTKAEEEAFPSVKELQSMSKEEALSYFLCIHQPHKTSEKIHHYLSHPSIVEVLTKVIGPDVKCMQSMLFIKASGKPGQAWHQDEDFIPTRDRSLLGAWIALDDAVVENGCLWILPGSHKPGVLWPMYPHDDPNYDCTQMSFDFPYNDADAIPVEVPKGAVVFFNGYTLHKSEPNNLKGAFRRVLVNHYMSASSLLPWQYSPENSIAMTDFRDIVLVAGKDPYAYKGTIDTQRPHVRAAGQGGCGDGRMNLETYKTQTTS